MKVGVVGGGYWGSKHVRVFSGLSGVEVSLVEPRAGTRERLQQSFPSLRGFASLADALPHLDAVVVATPPATHAALSLQAIDAGKHVLVEKPLATEVDDARRLVERSAAAGVVLMCGHTFEYNAAVWHLREIIERGDLGTVYFLDGARLNLGLYQQDVNVVWDLAPHDISIVNYLLGTTPDTVHAWGSPNAHAYLEDVAYLRLEYEQLEVAANIHVSWLEPCKVRRTTVVGSERMAVYNDLAADERLRIYDKGLDLHDDRPIDEPPVSYRQNGVYSPFVPAGEPLAVECQHFVDCIRAGATPRSDGISGLSVVEVLDAAQRSLREGSTIRLEPEWLSELQHRAS